MASILSRAIVLCLLAAGAPAHAAGAGDMHDWWQRLQSLCGRAFPGALVRAPEDDTTFRDVPLVMHVRQCSADRVRIPLVVGDDRSRTWVLTRTAAGIELRHDHRQRDGHPDAVTPYGGSTSNPGSAETQMFPADAATRDIPDSGQRSVWLMEIHPGTRFVYAANRVGTLRGFRMDFDLAHPVPAPDAPWGWVD
ncbi:hypothetical protein [Luteimonas deserti]|uniref:Secreted protein n=1 Tax=Luteimonas deserti TaxID=2752306 RepID=A0A7Z0TXT9_9GAMM|nr:hypothetical protein [Luteimonas deserti]NYZ62165.1 hypothetical protein [Luteimonas deserti]